MKILVFSDSHGRVDAIRLLMARYNDEKPSIVFGLGDFLYNGPRNGVPGDYEPQEAADILKNILVPHYYVRGNCDSRVDETVLGEELSDYLELVIEGRTFELYHGDYPGEKQLKKASGSVILSGHTHVPRLEKSDGVYYFNPGSTSFPKGGSVPSYMIIEGNKVYLKGLETGEIISEMNI